MAQVTAQTKLFPYLWKIFTPLGIMTTLTRIGWTEPMMWRQCFQAIKVQHTTVCLALFLILKPFQISLIYQWASLYPINWLISWISVFATFTIQYALKITEWKNLLQVGLKHASSVWTAAMLLLTQKPKSLQCVHNWTQKLKKLDNGKISDLRKKNSRKSTQTRWRYW